MISARLVELIQNHAPQLTSEFLDSLQSDERAPSFRRVPRLDMEARVFQILNHLGDWIAAANESAVRAEFEQWGRKRFGQGIPLSEIVHVLLRLKSHLGRYIRDHGLIDTALPRVDGDYVLPMHLHSLQDLNQMVSTFFDKALYYLARGYEAEAARGGRA